MVFWQKMCVLLSKKNADSIGVLKQKCACFVKKNTDSKGVLAKNVRFFVNKNADSTGISVSLATSKNVQKRRF